jgi:hypothetical protein
MTLDLNTAARYKVSYDLAVFHQVYARGDITVFLTWNLIDGRPSMVLVPTINAMTHERCIPCVVPLESAWRWSREHWVSENTPIKQAQRFLENLGFNPNNKKSVIRLMSIVNDYLGDLIKMPPLPKEREEFAADALITDNTTGKVVHKEIKDYA